VVWSEAAPIGTIIAGGLLVPWRRLATGNLRSGLFNHGLMRVSDG